jgi:hypothetical protein
MTLRFVGDILDTKGLSSEINGDVVRFFSDCDVMIRNFESIITDLPGHGTSVRHVLQIIDALEGIFPPHSTYLSIANNHAGDYPADVPHTNWNNGASMFLVGTNVPSSILEIPCG